MRRELEEELQEIAPTFLQEMNCNPAQSCMAWGIACGDGWFSPLAAFCKKVEELNKSMSDKVFLAEQIKEKFGELSVYWTLVEKGEEPEYAEVVRDEEKEKQFKEILDKLYEECDKRCEDCGAEGTMTVLNGWYRTLCKDCLERLKRRRTWEEEHDS